MVVIYSTLTKTHDFNWLFVWLGLSLLLYKIFINPSLDLCPCRTY